jgi:hypothetical protein
MEVKNAMNNLSRKKEVEMASAVHILACLFPPDAKNKSSVPGNPHWLLPA